MTPRVEAEVVDDEAEPLVRVPHVVVATVVMVHALVHHAHVRHVHVRIRLERTRRVRHLAVIHQPGADQPAEVAHARVHRILLTQAGALVLVPQSRMESDSSQVSE